MTLHGKIIAITGGAGFIGSWLADQITLYEPEKVVIIDNFFLGKEENLAKTKQNLGDRFKLYRADATDFEQVKNILWKEGKVDVVFNLAIKPLLVSFVDPVSVFETSVKIATNLLVLQRNEFFNTLIHFSSSEAYGSARYIPMDEKHPLRPTTPYGAGKAAADHLIISYYISYGNDVAIIRPFNNFGPRQNEKTYAGVIPTTILKILSRQPPVIFGDGTQTRDFIYVRETAEAAIKIYEKKSTRGRIINIGSGKETSINELIKNITTIMGYKGKIIFENQRPGDVKRHCSDVSLAKKLINFEPRISMGDALRETISWYTNRFGGRK